MGEQFTGVCESGVGGGGAGGALEVWGVVEGEEWVLCGLIGWRVGVVVGGRDLNVVIRRKQVCINSFCFRQKCAEFEN